MLWLTRPPAGGAAIRYSSINREIDWPGVRDSNGDERQFAEFACVLRFVRCGCSVSAQKLV